MTHKAHTMRFDFHENRISETGPFEHMGLLCMRIAAKSTRRIQYSGLRHLNKVIKGIFPSNEFIQVRFNDDTSFEFPYGDGYWGRLLDNSKTYSPCEENFLFAIRDLDYAFIDCGANFGYMSLLVSSKAFGSKPSIAVEADPNTFSVLERNWRLNGQRFEIRNNAVFSQSGNIVDFGGNKHEARSIQETSQTQNASRIETVALDDLKPWIKRQKKKHLILKLDVEGVEVAALEGSTSLLKDDPCVMYEDHGMDKTHEISRFLKDKLGMRLYFSEPTGCRELKSWDDIDAIKVNPRVGYDFIAARGDFWPQKIAELSFTPGQNGLTNAD